MMKLSEVYNNSINFLDDDDILMYLCNGGEIKGFNDGKGNINEDDRRAFLEKAYMQYVDSVNAYNSQNENQKPVLSRKEWINTSGNATHMFSSNVHVGTSFGVDSVKHRVYINSDARDKWKIADLFREKCEAKKLPYYFKLFDFDQEDNMVIYSHTEHLAEYIDILQEIEQEYPEMMQRCGKPPLLTRSKLNDWIGIADEPSPERYGRQSYNEVMEKIMQKKLIQLSDESIIKNYDKDKKIDVDGKSVSLQDALTEEFYNYIITEIKETGDLIGKCSFRLTGLNKEDLENKKFQRYLRNQIKVIFQNKSIEELMNDEIFINTKPPKGIKFNNIFDTNKKIKQLIKDNCCDFDAIRKDIKEFLSENGIDPDRPCFMHGTRSLFGVKEITKGQEQRTESTLKRRKSADI